MNNIPTSFSQKNIYYIDSFINKHFNISIYNVPIIIELEGELNILKLEKALNLVVNSNDSLRLIFKKDNNDNLFQKLLNSVAVKIKIYDISTSSPKEKKRESQNLIVRIINFRFNIFSNSPLYKFSIIKLEHNKYIFIAVFHHLLMDEWSIDIFLKLLEREYNSKKHESAFNNHPSFSYAKYCIEQQQSLRNGYYCKKISYWHDKFCFINKHEINAKIPKLNYITRSAFEKNRIDCDQTKKVDAFCRNNNISKFIFFISIYIIILKKFHETNNLVIASPAANRLEKDFIATIGCFVKTVVFSFKINNDWTFSELLEKVKLEIIETLDNQDSPIDAQVRDQKTVYTDRKIQSTLFEIKTQNKYKINFDLLKSKYFKSYDLSSHLSSKLGESEIIIELEYQIETYGHKFAKSFITIYKQIVLQIINNKNTHINSITNQINNLKTRNEKNNFNKEVKKQNNVISKVRNKLNSMLKLTVKL